MTLNNVEKIPFAIESLIVFSVKKYEQTEACSILFFIHMFIHDFLSDGLFMV